MSLERSLILSVFLVLLASLLVGAGLTYEHAASKVSTEMDAALAVGTRIVQNGLDDGEEQVNPSRRLMLIVGDFNGDRHLRAMLLDPAGKPITASEVKPPEDPAPQWFFDLVSGRKVSVNVDLPAPMRATGQVRLETDAHNEVSEAWEDLKLSLWILGFFFCLVLALTVRTLRGALRPLRELCDALTRVGSGDYGARLTWRHYRELEAVQHGFNGMAKRLLDMELENRLLERQVQSAQEDERSELARDLHDEVAPFLFSVSADASLIRQYVRQNTPSLVDARAEGILTSVGHMQKHLRNVLARLMPDVLLDLGLPGAVDSLVHFWKSHKPDIEFSADVTDEPLDDQSSTVAFRVVQESLSNAVRHARASKIGVAIRQTPEGLEVMVTDDGCGLPQAAAASGSGPAGLGLLGMRDRVCASGGRFEVSGRQGQPGVVVHAVVGHGADSMVES